MAHKISICPSSSPQHPVFLLQIFVELDELHNDPEEREWKETARWIKYEEDVEEGVDRWGKPHVASLSFHSLLNLRKCLEDGLVCLDMEEKDLPAIAYRITEDLYKEDLIREEDKAKIMRVLLLRHRHVNEHHERGFKFPKKHSYTSLQVSGWFCACWRWTKKCVCGVIFCFD